MEVLGWPGRWGSLYKANILPCGGTPATSWGSFSASPGGQADLGHSLPLPPLPMKSLASGSWRQLGRPTNFSPGHFLTPPPQSAFFSSPCALFERKHPGPERVLQFNYFQILCSGHPGTPLSTIESSGGRAGAPLRRRPESIRPPLRPLWPTEGLAKPGCRRSLLSSLLPQPLEASRPRPGYLGLILSGGDWAWVQAECDSPDCPSLHALNPGSGGHPVVLLWAPGLAR